MKEDVRLHYIKEILEAYKGQEPLHNFLRSFYKKYRQFGSRDRKFYSDTVYKYFRSASLLKNTVLEDALSISGFLTAPEPGSFYNHLLSKSKIADFLLSNWDLSLKEKLNILEENKLIDPSLIFPHLNLIDPTIPKEEFYLSRFIQPDLFIRAQKKFTHKTLQILEEKGVEFEVEGNCIRLSPKTEIDKLLPDTYYEVQDLSSQATLKLFEIKEGEKIWDCCSGSGGKSLMIMDAFPDTRLYCSDKRDTILGNLIKRFELHEVKAEAVFLYDAAAGMENEILGRAEFDLILADMPCSGSGTWSRTPEHYSFQLSSPEFYSGLQKKILINTLRYLKPGGIFIYITCSVYAIENTGFTEFASSHGLKLLKQEYFEGYKHKSDTLFGAVLMKE
jgi:16S rRNA (cytosine967-C5)-methyltransferase